MERNCRVFITVAKSSAPYVRIVCMMNSWPACTQSTYSACSAGSTAANAGKTSVAVLRARVQASHKVITTESN